LCPYGRRCLRSCFPPFRSGASDRPAQWSIARSESNPRARATEEAIERRHLLRQELQERLKDLPRTRVVDFGRDWLGVKRKTIDPGTYERYEAALEDHAFKAFGRMEFIDLRGLHVQSWINDEIVRG
jgi:hypothetical protein